jgi:hypothetical protein
MNERIKNLLNEKKEALSNAFNEILHNDTEENWKKHKIAKQNYFAIIPELLYLSFEPAGGSTISKAEIDILCQQSESYYIYSGWREAKGDDYGYNSIKGRPAHQQNILRFIRIADSMNTLQRQSLPVSPKLFTLYKKYPLFSITAHNHVEKIDDTDYARRTQTAFHNFLINANIDQDAIYDIGFLNPEDSSKCMYLSMKNKNNNGKDIFIFQNKFPSIKFYKFPLKAFLPSDHTSPTRYSFSCSHRTINRGFNNAAYKNDLEDMGINIAHNKTIPQNFTITKQVLAERSFLTQWAFGEYYTESAEKSPVKLHHIPLDYDKNGNFKIDMDASGLNQYVAKKPLTQPTFDDVKALFITK